MFVWLYQSPTPVVAVLVFAVTAVVAVGGFKLARRFATPRIKYHDGVNDVISGALGAIGVLYGITVGLIFIDVWQRHTTAEDIVVREAAAIQILYQMVSADIGSSRVVGGVGSDGHARWGRSDGNAEAGSGTGLSLLARPHLR